MTGEKIKGFLAPCDLCCETCFAHVDGDIRRYSLKPKEKLGNFRIYAERFETPLDDPVFKNYPWVMINRKIGEIGLDAFHTKAKVRPRYP